MLRLNGPLTQTDLPKAGLTTIEAPKLTEFMASSRDKTLRPPGHLKGGYLCTPAPPFLCIMSNHPFLLDTSDSLPPLTSDSIKASIAIL
ncbi:hypothetical protein UPYG_G00339880 [Umbra pygmaea]|uniref:Uncharacterized protein n=1 Tax=Umbra pygmaea TaxID=75934 RepID=A0ABD0VXY2_UMBPY